MNNLSWLSQAEHVAVHSAGYNAEWAGWVAGNGGADSGAWWEQGQYMAGKYGIPMVGGS